MTRTAAEPSLNAPEQVLSIPVDTVHFIIGKLREQKDECPDAAVLQELHSIIEDLPEGQQVDLVALAWLGRDSCSATDWQAIRGETAEVHYAHTARYLLGVPMVGNFLEEGLSILGVSGEHVIAGQPSYQTGKTSPTAPGAPIHGLRMRDTRSVRRSPSAQA